MSYYTKLYWLTRLDALHIISGIVLFLGCMCLVAYFLWSVLDSDNFNKVESKRLRNIFLSTSWIFIPISIIILTFIPTRNEMLFIYAGGKTMDFVEKDSSINKIPGQTTKMITDYLEKSLKEINSKK